MELKGLSSQEVKDRRKAGLVNGEERKTGQSYLGIFLRNLLTPFNIILFVLGAALIFFNDLINAFAATGVIIFNILISTLQEFKAKRRLDKIAVLMRPKATVVRDGEDTVIDRADIVMGDLVHLSAGDQAQVDGEIVRERSIEMDESLLTGESHTIRKKTGDTIFSGSLCVSGECWFQVNQIGDDTFSSKMTSAAKRFQKKDTPLQKETNAVTEFLMGVAFLFLFILVVLDFFRGAFEMDAYIRQAVIVLDIVPIALFLLITLTYMITAVRMADSGVLLQNSSSVESMSHVDTVCMDKTGTITTNNLVFEDIRYFTDDRERTDGLIREFMAATGSRNRTVLAIEERFGREDCELVDEIQFSSERKFSAVRVRKGDVTETIVMGAWPFLKQKASNPEGVQERLSELASEGLRSVVFLDGGNGVLHMNGEDYLPEMKVAAVIAIRDEIRPNCKEIIHEFTSNGMDVKIISGDDPETVEALFALAEIPGERKRVSGETLDSMSGEDFSRTVLETNIFGRMKPEQKEQVIDALRKKGRYVAMVGDGINDVRSIKKANVGVSVQTGSGAARGVADMVLMDDDFTALPKAIVEGKRTVSGMRDILRLYLSRNFVLMMVVLIMLLMFNKTPMIPIQNTLYAFLTVTVAAFFLTLFAKPTEGSDMVLPGVLRYVVPTTFTIVTFGFAVYALVYTATDLSWIDAERIFADMFATLDGSGFWKEYTDVGGLVDHLTQNGAETVPEVFARNAMLIFMIMAGIAQLLICFPLVKRLSVDGQYVKRYLPTLLAVLMSLLLVALYFYAPFFACTILSLVVFPPGMFAAIAAVTVLWAAVDIAILKNRHMDRINSRTEALVRESLIRSDARRTARENLRVQRKAELEERRKEEDRARSLRITERLERKRTRRKG